MPVTSNGCLHAASNVDARSRRRDAFSPTAGWGDEEPTPHETHRSKSQVRTVGAVALDQHGHLAAATSTGVSPTSSRAGGRCPLIGAGLLCRRCNLRRVHDGFRRDVHADGRRLRRRCANGVSRGIAGRSRGDVVMKRLPRIHGRGGLIAVDALGNVTLPFNTEGMYAVARVRCCTRNGDLSLTFFICRPHCANHRSSRFTSRENIVPISPHIARSRLDTLHRMRARR